MSQLKAIVDKLLTNVSSALVPEGHISEMLFPFVGVKQSSGLLAKYGLSHLRIENSNKGGRGAYRRVEMIARSSTSYLIEGHGLEGMVTKEDYKNVELPYKAEEDETMGIVTSLWLEKEKVLADALSSTSVMTQNTTLAGANQLSDYNNSDPIAVFAAARLAVRNGCGLPPNVAWMDWAVKNKLKFHPQLLDFLGFKQARPGGLSDQELAQALDVEKVLIAKPMYNSAKEGQADVLASVWGKHIGFGVLPDRAMPYQVSLGYRFGYEGEQPRKVYKYALNNPPESTGILVEDNYDYVVSNVGAGYLIKDAVA